jgi:DNA-binding transcriptional MerR regulator
VSQDGKGLTVQEMAARTGLSVHTLRYYEREHLIAPISREESSGHRRYSEEDAAKITFLLKLRATGMSIREMQRFVALTAHGDATIPERKKILEEHRCAVRAQVEELEGHLQVIETKIALYARKQAERNGKQENEPC